MIITMVGGVTDNYNADRMLGLELGKDFVESEDK